MVYVVARAGFTLVDWLLCLIRFLVVVGVSRFWWFVCCLIIIYV